jgi:hypothetical protein
MSTPPATSLLNCAAAHRCTSARHFGEHIRIARTNDGRPLEDLAPKAGLSVEEWQAIEDGQLPETWEQVLLLGMVLRIGPKWMKRLRKLCESAARQEPDR